MTEIKITRSDGSTFNYSDGAWKIKTLNGVDSPEVEIFSESKGFGNGDIITGIRKKAREIKIVTRLKDMNVSKSERKRVLAFHNANYTYEIEITYLGTTRVVKDCRLESCSYPTNKSHLSPDLTVEFFSPYAVLFADFTDNEQMFSITGKWHCDRYYVDEAYTEGTETIKATQNIYGVETRIESKNIYYSGSENAPIIATLTATGVITENITLTVNDNSLVVDCDLTTGDVLEINAETYDVLLNDEAISPSLYNSEVFPDMNMEYGDNTVSITAEDNLAFSSVINYTGRYDGV